MTPAGTITAHTGAGTYAPGEQRVVPEQHPAAEPTLYQPRTAVTSATSLAGPAAASPAATGALSVSHAIDVGSAPARSRS
jgi:hypothetical protein